MKKKVKESSRERQVKRQEVEKENDGAREGERYRHRVREVAVSVCFCVPHGFIPFCLPFIHNPSLAHTVMLTLSRSFHPFLFSSSPFSPPCYLSLSFLSCPSLFSLPSPSFNSAYFVLSFLLSFVPVLYLFPPPCLHSRQSGPLFVLINYI